jgi:tripartite-type tricarboxylate transporter receptor subunit TctC
MTRIGAFLLGISVAAGAAFAQTYPAKTVKIIVPYGAGGPADIYARFIGARLSETMGQPFVVEDRPGGGAVVGTDAVVKSTCPSALRPAWSTPHARRRR